MRSFWTGTISFGLINIPIRLYSATQEKDLALHMLRKGDLCPINYARICRSTGEEVPWSDVVKGYEIKKGEYVVLDDEDYKRADPKKTQTIEVLSFADEREIDVKYFDKPYYLGPGKGGTKKAYVLLREALKRADKVGIARYVLRTREYIGVLKADGDVLLLNQLRYKSEIVSPREIDLPKTADVSRKEIDVALQLIDALTEPFKAEQFKDTYHQDLMKIIESKAKGRKPRLKLNDDDLEPTAVPDLMAKLQSSLEHHHARRRAAA